MQTEIAIVGAACRFPGAGDLDAFWSLLAEGRQAVGTIDKNRWATDFYGHPRASELGKSYTWAAGVIEHVERFDPAFFGISAREAAQMDPQQRLLLELAWEAFEDGGLLPKSLRGIEAGVYIGASGTEYMNLNFGDPSAQDAYFMTGNQLSIFSNRISYIFDLKGPSFTVDTACSSSMVALHLACQDIRSGKVPMALVGGVNLLLSPFPFIGFSRASMLSRLGRCASFDADGDGYVRGEGAGVALLKPLKQAIADGDRIRGIILGTGINSDGRTIGMSFPSQQSQAALLDQVYGEFGVDPDTLGFVEAHGTGTAAGDPVEAGAIGTALGTKRRQKLPIGSVKTNIGHLEPASGMAGLFKAMLALDKGVLPPSLNFTKLNPKIDAEALNLTVASEALPLADDAAMTAGISSFGFGGTNAHAILATPRRAVVAVATGDAPVSIETRTAQPLPPLLLSAQTSKGLSELAQTWAHRLEGVETAEAAALVRGAARRRTHHTHRLAALGKDVASLTETLTGFAEKGSNPRAVTDTQARDGKVGFLFSGNGAQYAGMAVEALDKSAGFARAMAEVDALLTPELGWSVVEKLRTIKDNAEIARTDIVQPLLFAIQVAIVGALAEYDVKPQMVAGHSVGEIAAAWACGALTLKDAAHIVVARSRQQERTAGLGRMAVLGLPAAEAETFLKGLDVPVEIAAINSSKSLTIAGTYEGLKTVEAAASQRGCVFTMLDLDYAFHSSIMAPIKDGLLDDLAHVSSVEPPVTFISTVTAKPVTAGELNAAYWWHNVRDVVRFNEAVVSMIEQGTDILIEIGPQPILLSYVRDAARASQTPRKILSTLTRKPIGDDPFRRIAGAAHTVGIDISGSAFYDGPVMLDGLPGYPWQREDYIFPTTAERVSLARPQVDGPLLGYRWSAREKDWFNHIDLVEQAWLDDHKVDHSPIFPAAGIIELALELAANQMPAVPMLEIRDLDISRAMTLDAAKMKETRVGLEPGGLFQLESRSRHSEDPWTVHATGTIGPADGGLVGTSIPDGAPMRSLESQELYELTDLVGLQYGPEFQQVARLDIHDPQTAVAHFKPVTAIPNLLSDPRVVDGTLQGILGLLAAQHDGEGALPLLLPWRFDAVRFDQAHIRAAASAVIRLRRPGALNVTADIVLLDIDGQALMTLRGGQFRPAPSRRSLDLSSRLFRVAQVPAPLERDAPEAASHHLASLREALGAFARDKEYADEAALLIDAFVAVSAYEAIAHIMPAGSAFSVSTGIGSGVIAEDAGPLLDRLLLLLEGHGAARRSGSLWQLEADTELPAAKDIWQSLFYGHRDLAALSSVLAWAGDSFPKRLTKGAGAIASLPAAFREQLVSGQGTSARGGDGAIETVAQALDAVIRDWPADRPLHVLELGNGTGLLAARVMPMAARSAIAVDYTVAEADADTARLVASRLPSAEGLSITHRDALASHAGRYDIVISACAASTGPAIDFAAIRALLAPGGLVTLAEPEPNSLWDASLGLQAGWWRVDEPGASMLRSADEWHTALIQAGFEDVGSLGIRQDSWPCIALTARAPLSVEAIEAVAPPPVAILCEGDDRPVAEGVQAALQAVGGTVVLLSSNVAASVLREAIGGLPSHGKPARIVLLTEPEHGTPLASAVKWVDRSAYIARALADTGAELWLVTRGAEHDTVAAGIQSLARVMANELPKLAPRRIDIEDGLSTAEIVTALSAELTSDASEREVLLAKGKRMVARMRAGLPKAMSAASADTARGPLRLTLADGLQWVSIPAAQPGEGEVAIAVKAAGLNFRDVMWALSLIPEEAMADGFAGCTLGMECGGVISAVGPGVRGFSVGDRVMAFAPAAFASEVVTRADCVLPLNNGFSFADGATVPVAFLTVMYSLRTLGRLKKGETVLIHGGAGAVGLAAIQYAMHVGATVITTAGSDVKRALLRAAGVEHVLDSRSLRFADEVRELTGGKGVDVVLNSLSGDAMRRSLELVKPFGRFLELGKRDFYANTRIGLRPVRHNVSYFAIDADELVSYHPEIVAEILAELRELFEAESLRPLPRFTLPFSEIDDAFRLMRASGHVGKIVLIPDAEAEADQATTKYLQISADKTVIVSGGIAGFGLATARWLVRDCGVRHVALLGRRGEETPGAGLARQALLDDGATTVKIAACDVADEASLRRELNLIRGAMPPIGGVVHAAMVLLDGLVSSLDAESITKVLTPKLQGALLLDKLTRFDPLELFLMFSSATTLLGSPGQASYVAANAGLEALARKRRARGLPGLAVGWGPIADAGYLADQHAARDSLTRRLGALPMKASDSLRAIPAMLGSGAPVLALSEVNWSKGRDNLPILSEPMFSGFGAQGAGTDDASDVLDLIEGKTPAEMQTIIQSFMLDEVSTILRVTRDKLDPHRPLPEIGMDSLMAMELRVVLERKLHIEIPTLVLNESLTLSGLATKVVGMLSGEAKEDTAEILLAQHENADASQTQEILEAATAGQRKAAGGKNARRMNAGRVETV